MTTTNNKTTPNQNQIKRISYNAYLAYVRYIGQEITTADVVEQLQPYAGLTGCPITIDTIGQMLTLRMTSYGRLKGQVGRNVKSIDHKPITPEDLQSRIDRWPDRIEQELDKLGYYQDALDALSAPEPERAPDDPESAPRG